MSKGISGMMKQAQKLQQQIEKIQEDLANQTVEGSAGGGMVTVVANGRSDIISLKIDKEVVNPDDVEMLEDLILSAIKQAIERSQELADSEMKKATSGMVPGGLKLPGF